MQTIYSRGGCGFMWTLLLGTRNTQDPPCTLKKGSMVPNKGHLGSNRG